MAFKIKEGSEIAPYGATGNTFTSASVLSQAVLEHLATRFPDDVVNDTVKKPAADKAAADKAAAEINNSKS